MVLATDHPVPFEVIRCPGLAPGILDVHRVHGDGHATAEAHRAVPAELGAIWMVGRDTCGQPPASRSSPVGRRPRPRGRTTPRPRLARPATRRCQLAGR